MTLFDRAQSIPAILSLKLLHLNKFDKLYMFYAEKMLEKD